MIKQLLLVGLLILGCAPDDSQNTARAYSLTDGSSIDLTSPEKLVIINYWATWCAPCRKASPRLEKIYAKYKNKGLRVYGISTEDREVLEVYERNNPSTYPLLVDEEGRFPKALGASKLPTFVLVDAENKVQRIVTGVNGLNVIEESLKTLFD